MGQLEAEARHDPWGTWLARLRILTTWQDDTGWHAMVHWWNPLTWLLLIGVWLWLVWRMVRTTGL